MSDEPVTGAQCRGIEKPLLPPGSLCLGGEMSGTTFPQPYKCEMGGDSEQRQAPARGNLAGC